MNNSFSETLTKFMILQKDKLQLDFLRKNGQVLIQLFRQSDMLDWNIDFKIKDTKGYCMVLFFNKNKENSFSRFQRTDSFESYIYSKSLGVDAYFKMISNNISLNSLGDECFNVIQEVYDYQDEINYNLVSASASKTK